MEEEHIDAILESAVDTQQELLPEDEIQGEEPEGDIFTNVAKVAETPTEGTLESGVVSDPEGLKIEAFNNETAEGQEETNGALPLGVVAADGTTLPPETGQIAQVILISTSLGSIRHQFFGSLKAKQFLDCKGIPYYLIDANRDVSRGANLKDQELLQSWSARGLLARDAQEDALTKFVIPQILIDGVSIGSESTLQDMEEDGDFDWVFVRAACPACYNERDPSDAACSQCGTQFEQLIPEELVAQRSVQRLVRGLPYFGDDAENEQLEEGYSFTPVGAAREPAETLTYEGLFGEAPPADSVEE